MAYLRLPFKIVENIIFLKIILLRVYLLKYSSSCVLTWSGFSLLEDQGGEEEGRGQQHLGTIKVLTSDSCGGCLIFNYNSSLRQEHIHNLSRREFHKFLNYSSIKKERTENRAQKIYPILDTRICVRLSVLHSQRYPPPVALKGTQPRGLRINSELPLGASVCTSCLALGFRIGTS